MSPTHKSPGKSGAMPSDPRDQAWLLWRKRLEGGDPLETARNWLLEKGGVKTSEAARAWLAAIYGRLMGNPETFGFDGGSSNWPWVAAAAKGDLAWAEKAAATDLERGIGRLELGAPGYSAERLLAQADLLSLKPEGWPGDAYPNLRELVRRQWLIHSLSMVPAVPNRIHIYGHDGVDVLEGKDATASWYSGWTCTLPQTRVNSDSMVNGLLSFIVTKAMGASATYKRHADSSPESPYWPLAALIKIGFTTLQSPGAAWAATSGNPPTDEVLSGLRSTFRWSLYQTDAGTACWIGWRGEDGIEPGPTSWKPTSLFNRMDRSGEQWIALPQRWARQTDDKGEATLLEFRDIKKVSVLGRNTRYTLDLPPGRPTLWLEFGPDGARRVA